MRDPENEIVGGGSGIELHAHDRAGDAAIALVDGREDLRRGKRAIGVGCEAKGRVNSEPSSNNMTVRILFIQTSLCAWKGEFMGLSKKRQVTMRYSLRRLKLNTDSFQVRRSGSGLSGYMDSVSRRLLAISRRLLNSRKTLIHRKLV